MHAAYVSEGYSFTQSGPGTGYVRIINVGEERGWAVRAASRRDRGCSRIDTGRWRGLWLSRGLAEQIEAYI